MALSLENEIIAELIKAAAEARKKAYAPYSSYQVGAAVLTNDERIYSGCNIENASYGATICAERTAVLKAVSEGKRKLLAIAVIGGKGEDQPSEYAYPCGICRQVMVEFAEKPEEFTIILAKSVSDYKTCSLTDLLPEAFKLI